MPPVEDMHDGDDAACRAFKVDDGKVSIERRFDGGDVGRSSDPGYVVFSMPIAGQGRMAQAHGQTTPVLAVRTSAGEVLVPHSTLSWARHLTQQNRSPESVLQDLHTIGRFAEYVDRVHGSDELDPDTLTLAIYAYVAYRAGNRLPGDPDCEALPNWPPVSESKAWNEYRALARFFSYSGASDIKVDIAHGVMPTKRFYDAAAAYKVAGSRDFFVHLAPQRERWRRMMVDSDLVDLREQLTIRPRNPTPTALTTTMSREEVEAIIRAERSPMFKALWILLAFGGCRISEALNLWQIDVMPGSWSRHFGDLDASGQPFVLLADPAEGRFVGDIGNARTTRQDYLKDKYGRAPRSKLPSKHPERAGWKSMLVLSSEWNASWIYWIDGPTADAFSQLAVEIRAFHRRYKTSERHPYFFANMTRADSLGGLLKYRSAAKAFERACLRAGLDPHRFHRNIHGFRHFYKWYAERELKLSPEIRQIMLHHRSIDSQVDYGRKAADVAEALAKVMTQAR